jgi:FAD binding domain-containing protein
MTAALVAALEGLHVLVCEKSRYVGGTSATSAGTVWIPRDRDEAQLYLDGLIGGPMQRDLSKAYLATGPAAIDYLAAKSEMKFVDAGTHPDYREIPGAAMAGRALSPLPSTAGGSQRTSRAFVRPFRNSWFWVG